MSGNVGPALSNDVQSVTVGCYLLSEGKDSFLIRERSIVYLVPLFVLGLLLIVFGVGLILMIQDLIQEPGEFYIRRSHGPGWLLWFLFWFLKRRGLGFLAWAIVLAGVFGFLFGCRIWCRLVRNGRGQWTLDRTHDRLLCGNKLLSSLSGILCITITKSKSTFHHQSLFHYEETTSIWYHVDFSTGHGSLPDFGFAFPKKEDARGFAKRLADFLGIGIVEKGGETGLGQQTPPPRLRNEGGGKGRITDWLLFLVMWTMLSAFLFVIWIGVASLLSNADRWPVGLLLLPSVAMALLILLRLRSPKRLAVTDSRSSCCCSAEPDATATRPHE